MKNRKGFTLVELIGTFAILAVVLTIVAVAWTNINKSLEKAYYNTLEESILISGGEYFANNKGKQPKLLGEEQTINIGYLVTNKYSQDDIKARNGTLCDYDNSYVAAYKDSSDRTNYYVCLKCGSYETNSLACNGEVNYSLNVLATEKDSNKYYRLTGEDWASNDINLTFKTLNAIDEVYLTDTDGNVINKCQMIEKNDGIRSCQVIVNNTGNYKFYGKVGDKETEKQDAIVKIDKTKPTFIVPDDQVIAVENIDEGLINALIENIKDPESGIKSIEYSLEKEGSQVKYNSVSVKDSFTVNETRELGKYILTVRVTNNASLSEVKTVNYYIKRKVDIPTSAYCNSLTYNGFLQTLTKTEGLGYTFINNKATDAGDYTVTARLMDNYIWSLGNDLFDKTFVCVINQKNINVKAKNQQITYGENIEDSVTKVSVSGLISGHELSDIKLTSSTVNVTGDNYGTLTPSDGKVKSGSNDVTQNYKFNYETGVLIILPKNVNELTATLNETLYVYDGTAKKPIPTVKFGTETLSEEFDYEVSYSNNVNAGTATVTVVGKGNYEGTVSIDFTIQKREITVTAKNQTIEYGTSIALNDSITVTNLVSGHTVTNITLTPSTSDVVTNGKITPSSAIIRVDRDEVTSNYDISYAPGTLVITRSKTATLGSCNSLTYNGLEQTLASGGNFVSYTNNSKIDAGSYEVVINTDSNHAFEDGTTSKKLTCSIGKRDTIIKAKDQVIKYGTSISFEEQITATNLASGHVVSDIKLTPSTTNITTNGTIKPSDAIIKSGTNDVTSNYNISYANGTLTITEVATATTGSCNILTYNGLEQTLASGGNFVSYTNNSKIDAGSYEVVVTTEPNYTFADGTTSKKLTCSIGKRDTTVTALNQTIEYGNAITVASQITATNLVSGHMVTNITLTPSTNEVTTNGTITPSEAIIKVRGELIDVTNNYNISYAPGTLVITRAKNATLGSCNDLTYDGTYQTLASGGNFVSYTNNSKIDAGSYEVVINTDSNHAFEDGTTSKKLTCSIGKRKTTVTALNQTIEYGSAITVAAQITATNLVSGHMVTNITLTPSTSEVTTNGKITPSEAIIKVRGETTDLTSNYDISYAPGTLVITRLKTATTGSCNSLTYNGLEQTLASAGNFVNYINNLKTDAGSYEVVINADSNHAFADGTISKKLTCSIAKRNTTVTAKNQTIEYGGTITVADQITATNLVSGHMVTNITLTPSTSEVTTNGKITPSEAIIRAGSTDLTNNYNISYASGTLVITRLKTATPGSCYDLKYTGSSQTLAGGGYQVTYSNNSGIEAGTYTVTVNANSNYAFSDGSTSQTLACIIEEPKAPVVSISINGETYGSGYKSGAKVTVTCTSEDAIASFDAYDNTGDHGTVITNGTNVKTNQITLSSASSNRVVTGTCTSVNGLSATDSKTYKIYVYSENSVCGFSSYSYSGRCTCANGNGDSCTSSMYVDGIGGSCSNWCTQVAMSSYEGGSCTRTTNYKSCYHT